MAIRCCEERVVLERGRTVDFSELPDHAVALDGYVPGPHIDTARRRFSFDHHAGCIRHATLSTCEMALDAVRVGLEPADLTLHVNDLDADTVLASWVLLRPRAARHDRVVRAVRALGRTDALGPAVGGEPHSPALRWALAPMFEPGSALRQLSEAEWGNILETCVARLDRWLSRGARRNDPELRPKPRPRGNRVRILHEGTHWVLAQGSAAFAVLYRAGRRAAVLWEPLADGSNEFTVGKASEFVSGFDVPAILEALRRAERLANPAQLESHSWGGGSTIGGSPRNPDGSASLLGWKRVAEIVDEVVSRGVHALTERT